MTVNPEELESFRLKEKQAVEEIYDLCKREFDSFFLIVDRNDSDSMYTRGRMDPNCESELMYTMTALYHMVQDGFLTTDEVFKLAAIHDLKRKLNQSETTTQ